MDKEKETKRIVFRNPNKSMITRRDSREVGGHSWAQETKRNGMELSVLQLKENGIPQPHRWWNDSKKQVISVQEYQCSESWISERE